MSTERDSGSELSLDDLSEGDRVDYRPHGATSPNHREATVTSTDVNSFLKNPVEITTPQDGEHVIPVSAIHEVLERDA